MNDGWRRVAQAVHARRLELGLRQAGTPGVSAASWRKLERAKQDSYKPFLLRNVERTLGWPAGAIGRLLAGDAPDVELSVADTDITERLAALEQRFERIERAIEALQEQRRRR